MTLEEAEQLAQAREERRRRIVRAVRGYFYRERRIRRVFATVCGIAAFATFLASACLHSMGMKAMILRWPVSLAVGSGVALFAIRFWADREYGRFALAGDVARYLDVDDREEQQTFEDGTIETAVWRGFHSGTQTSGSSGGGCLLLILWPVLWTYWQIGKDLQKVGPSLLAEVFVDGPLVEHVPALVQRMPTRRWFVTAFDFAAPRVAALAMLLAGCAIILAVVAPDATTLWEACVKIRADAVRSGRH